MNRIETEYQKKLKIKKMQQAAFRKFLRGQATPIKIREWIGLNFLETKALLESRMLDTMSWQNYGSHWIVDHVAPFWIFDMHNEADMKTLWHPANLMPMIWKDNNHKQGHLAFAIKYFTRIKGNSVIIEKLLDRLIKEDRILDKYLPN